MANIYITVQCSGTTCLTLEEEFVARYTGAVAARYIWAVAARYILTLARNLRFDNVTRCHWHSAATHCDSQSYKQARRLGVLSIVVDFWTAWKRKSQYPVERGNFGGQYSTKKSLYATCPKNLTAKKVTHFWHFLLCTLEEMGNQNIWYLLIITQPFQNITFVH